MKMTFRHAAGQDLAGSARADLKRLGLCGRLRVRYVSTQRVVRLTFRGAPQHGFEFPVRALEPGHLQKVLEGFARRQPRLRRRDDKA